MGLEDNLPQSMEREIKDFYYVFRKNEDDEKDNLPPDQIREIKDFYYVFGDKLIEQ